MTIATVRYIANGFTVNWAGSQAVGVPASLYAATIPEAVYWLGRIFDPVAAAPASLTPKKAPAPRIIDSADPLMGQEAQVTDVASGGFVVRQNSVPGGGMRPYEAYSSTMDGVSDLLTQIFTPPAPAAAR